MEASITQQSVKKVYEKMAQKIPLISKKLKRPLSLTEKILFTHLDSLETQKFLRGESFLSLRPDRVAMQDATAQMALLQFMLSGRDKSCVPATVHCDHLIRAYEGMTEDMKVAMSENKEVFDFLASASNRYGIGFWKPGAGIIHQVVLENYAFPGGLMIGTDSHTPNAGGLGMVACGVGGADAADVMAGFPWEVRYPKLVGVHLKGQLKGWTAPKDVILKLCGLMTVKGGTNKIIEYFGSGCTSISCTGKGTITNMGAELGATCSLFPYDQKMFIYLESTGRKDIAKLAEQYKHCLQADQQVLENPQDFYDEIIEIDLEKLEPHIVGPHSPDFARPLSEMKEEVKKQDWPVHLSAALIGSCTNSSYEDLGRAADVAKQALQAGIKMPQQFMVSPGSMQIKNTIARDGQLKILEQVGAQVLANACGPCIGQWRRDDFKKGQVNTIVSSFNRNFRGRNDANPETLSFLTSPEITMALGLAGRLDFNPMTDTLPQNPSFRFKSPQAPELPSQGFVADPEGYLAPQGTGKVQVSPNSQRLQLLKPFEPWNGQDWQDILVLAKVKGKCTTDHISPAGPWLKYRGHLENISQNMLTGATNAFTGERGQGVNLLNRQTQAYSEIAKHYKQENKIWLIVGEENYGEGSSREHAAMSPRYLGAVAVIVKSFARIHETNLKKQGVLALTFKNPSDYDLFEPDTKVSFQGLKDLKPKQDVILSLTDSKGVQNKIVCSHSFNKDQIRWFQAGSALNYLRSHKSNSST